MGSGEAMAKYMECGTMHWKSGIYVVRTMSTGKFLTWARNWLTRYLHGTMNYWGVTKDVFLLSQKRVFIEMSARSVHVGQAT
jgi:hypothetical protein